MNPKIEKLSAFYNDKSIEEAERITAGTKLLPLLIEQINRSKVPSLSYEEDFARLKIKCAKLEMLAREFKGDNFVLTIKNKRLAKELIKTDRLKTNYRKSTIILTICLVVNIIIALIKISK